MALFYKVTCSCLKGLFKLAYSHEVYLPENSSFDGGAIIAANHASFLDPPLIASSWPEPIHFLARKTLFDVPLLSPIIKSLNAHPLGGSHDLSSLKLACQLVQSGKKVLIFPEGTRSKDGTISSFKQGIGMLVQRAECAIIPTYIHGSFEAWSRSQKWPKCFGVKTACVFGKPLTFDLTGDRKQVQLDIAKKLEAEIANLRTLYLSSSLKKKAHSSCE